MNMADIYYVKDKNQLRDILLYIFKQNIESESLEEALEASGICACKYAMKCDIEECVSCELDKCLLYSHSEDSDCYKNVLTRFDDIEFPCIVCYADTYHKRERLTVVSVETAKDNAYFI